MSGIMKKLVYPCGVVLFTIGATKFSVQQELSDLRNKQLERDSALKNQLLGINSALQNQLSGMNSALQNQLSGINDGIRDMQARQGRMEQFANEVAVAFASCIAAEQAKEESKKV
ncbi:MAG: hypothetical protein Q9184_007638 [Pyrenodesmia sp. 2 TL-2023]